MTQSVFGRLTLVCVTAFLLAACGAAGAPPIAPGSAAAANAPKPAGCAQLRSASVTCTLRGIRPAERRAVSGFGPADFQARYRLPSSTKGGGQVVAVVDAYDNPNVGADLATYRSNYGLGTANFTKYNQQGQTGNYPQGSSAWGVESDLDVEMVSAACPLCTIDLIEANSATATDLSAAEVEAVKLGAHIVSNSWDCGGCVSKKAFGAKGVVYVAAGGEGGAPAYFDTVVSVGGTTLSKNGSQYSESPWNGSPGGCWQGIRKPKWQRDIFCSYRLTNDVSAVANNVAEYDSYGYGGWINVSGTSASAPLIAGIFGLAGNATQQKGGRTFWIPRHHRHLYALGGSCGLYGYGQYSTCGGWGSPKGIGAF